MQHNIGLHCHILNYMAKYTASVSILSYDSVKFTREKQSKIFAVEM